MMTINTKKNEHKIERKGGLNRWLMTIEALLDAIGKQDPNDRLTPEQTQSICELIKDMLPTDRQVDQIEDAIAEYQNQTETK